MADQGILGAARQADIASGPQDLLSVAHAADLAATRAAVAVNQDNPDQAAQAVSVGNAIGVPPPVVNRNLDFFQKLQAKSVNSDLIGSSPHLQGYINSDPMAASVSHDDLAALHQAGEAIDNLPKVSTTEAFLAPAARSVLPLAGSLPIMEAGSGIGATIGAFGGPAAPVTIPLGAILGGAVAGVIGGYGLTAIQGYLISQLPTSVQKALGQTPEQLKAGEEQHPIASFAGNLAPIALTMGIRGSLLQRGISGALMGGFEAGQEKLQEGKVNPTDVALSTLFGLAFAKPNRLGEALEAPGNALAKRFANRVAPWIEEKKTVPYGLDPTADALKRYNVDIDDADLRAALEKALETKTRERSSDMFSKFADGITAGELGIPIDAVKELYKDARPMPGDGLLGWVPDIKSKFDLAEANGGDIQIPVSDWLAHVTPEVAKALQDDIRHRPDGLTKNEVQALPTEEEEAPAPTSTDPGERAAQTVADVRRAYGVVSKPLPVVQPLNKDLIERWQKVTNKQIEADHEYAMKVAMSAEKLKQSAEWKDNRAKLWPEVQQELSKRPDIAAYDFLTDGTLFGKDVGKVQLDSSALTPEQRKVLPREIVGKMGVHPDEIATRFGYGSGDAMIADLAKINEAKKSSGLNSMLFKRRLIGNVVDQRMKEKYGDLQGNIVDAATRHVFSAQLEAKLKADATLAAVSEGKDYEDVQRALDAARLNAIDKFEAAPLNSVRSNKLMAEIGRADRLMERSGLMSKPRYTTALVARERKYVGAIMAQRALDIEKLVGQWKDTVKKVAKAHPKGLPESHANYIHEILNKVGVKIQRSVEDLQKQNAAINQKPLADWIAEKNIEGEFDGTVIPDPEFILDPDFNTSFENLSVEQFRDVKALVDAIYKNGRDEDKWIREGEEADKNKIIDDLITQMKAVHTTPDVENKVETKLQYAKNLGEELINALKSMEEITRRYDRRNPKGIFTKIFMYPGAEAANYIARLQRNFHSFFADMSKVRDPKKLIDVSNFIDPKSEKPIGLFNRGNLEALIANIGTIEGRRSAAYTMGMTQDGLMAFIEKHTTAEDIDRAEARGKAWAAAKDQHDIVERNVNGFASANTQVLPFTMHGKDYQGWYHPLIDDPRNPASKKQIPDPEKHPTSFWPSVATGFTKRRTGKVHYLDLNPDRIPLEFNKLLHAIAFKSFVHNTAKIVMDKRFKQAMINNFGELHWRELHAWLTDIAGNASYNDRMLARITTASNILRQNAISTYIAFNPYTIQKHGLSAGLMSAKQLGGIFKGMPRLAYWTGVVGRDFAYHAVADLFSKDPYLGNTLWKFIWDNSEEIQRRSRNWQETVMGQHEILFGKSTLRHIIAQLGASGVALSDMLSAAPLWLAKYREVMAENGIHGDAVDQANAAVRLAHGSTAITSLPRAVRRSGILGSWMTTFYGFTGNVFQRQLETYEDISDAARLGLSGDIKSAAKMIPTIASGLFAYFYWPSAVSQMVSSEYTNDRRTVAEKARDTAIDGATLGILGLREFSWGLTHGGDLSLGGLAVGSAKDEVKFLKELIHPMKSTERQNLGKSVRDGLTAYGLLSGRMPKTIASAIGGGVDTALGVDVPHTPGGIVRKVTRGTTRETIER